jgi:hypothetical protein
MEEIDKKAADVRANWRLKPGTCRPVPMVRRCRALPDLV